MEKQSTLDGFEAIAKRRCGNTTRLVDRAIQILFSGKICIYLDHKDNGGDRQTNGYLLKKILRRLEIEHSIKKEYLIIDKEKQEVEIIPYKYRNNV